MKSFKRLFALIVIFFAFSAPGPQTGGWGLGGNPRPGTSQAQFQFANSTGSGVGALCSGSSMTDTRGNAMTFARGSSATCTRGGFGLRTTSINNGDLVTVTSGQPRAMSDANGISGILIQQSRTNLSLYSQQFDHATWSTTSSGVAVPTVTANAATAPDGTLTAQRIQFPAVTAAQISLIFQSISTTGVTSSSVYLKGNGSSGSICMAIDSVSGNNVLCPYVASSWSRCVLTKTPTTAAHPLYFGNYGTSGGSCAGAQGAADVFVWGAQLQSNNAAFVTSYIATTSASVTRASQVADFMGIMPSGTTRSLSAYFSPIPGISWSASGPTVQFSGGSAGTNIADPYFWIYSNGGRPNLQTRTTGSPSPAVVNGAALPNLPTTQGSVVKIGAYMTATAVGLCQDSSCATETAFTPGAFTFTRIQIGYTSTSSQVNAIVSRVCADTSPTRCR